MKIKINNYDFDLKYSIRTNILYENTTNESLDYSKLERMDVVTLLFYCNVLGNIQAIYKTVELSWDDFLNWLDDNGGIVKLNEYATWLAEQIQLQAKLVGESENTEKKKGKGKGSKKNK